MHDPQEHNRLEFLIASAAVSASVLWNRSRSACELVDENRKFTLHTWERDPHNPIFEPRSEFDASGAQGPFVVLHDGIQRTCLATANPETPTEWERHGPILDLGAKDAFDERSATYPCVLPEDGKLRLFYNGSGGGGTGIGMAVATMLEHS